MCVVCRIIHSGPGKLQSFHLSDINTGHGCTLFRHQKLVHLCNAIYPLHSFNFPTYLSQLSTNFIHLIYLYYSKHVPLQHLLALRPDFQGPLTGFVIHLLVLFLFNFILMIHHKSGCCCYIQMYWQEPNYTIDHLVLKLNETE